VCGAIILPAINPKTFGNRNSILSRNAILEVSLKEDGHSEEVTGVGAVSLLAAKKMLFGFITLWSPDSSTREYRDKEVTT